MISLEKINRITTILFLVSIMVIPRSYILIKLSFLSLFMMSHLYTSYVQRKIKVSPVIFLFYFFVAMAGLIWSVVGFLNDGAPAGVQQNFRLWFFWSMAYALIISLLRQTDRIEILHKSIVLAGIFISLLNFVGMMDFYFVTGIIPDSILTELDLRIGFHEGYVQITSHNIGSLLFIVPYLISVQFRKDSGASNGKLEKVSLILCILLTIFSGRRALWLCVTLTPVIILCFALVSRSFRMLTRTFKIFMIVLSTICIVATTGLFLISGASLEIPTIEHLKEAFSAEDERSIQKVYLINSFKDYPVFGSGFGANAGYVRSEKEPWLYELTYHQLLFNFGIVGMLYLSAFFLLYLYLIIGYLRKHATTTWIAFSIMIGFFAFLLGAYSNPYFMSFDFLIYIGMLPFLASYNPVLSKRQDVIKFQT